MQQSSLLRHLSATIGLVLLFALGPTASRADILYVDSGSNIDKIDSNTGSVSLFVTLAGTPTGLAFDATGNLYAGNSSTSGTLFKITPAGTVTTVGSNLFNTTGLTSDAQGNIYAVAGGAGIYKIAPNGTQSFVAGILGNGGTPDVRGLTIDSAGNLYAASYNLGNVSKITPAGVVSTFATLPTGADATGLANDGFDNIYAASVGHITGLYKITPAGTATSFTGGFYPSGIAFDGSGNLYGTGTSSLYKITPAGTTSTLVSGFAGGYIVDAVPEPSICALLLTGASALLFGGWKRSRRVHAGV